MRTFALIAAAGMSADAFLMKRDDESEAAKKCAAALSGKGFAEKQADVEKCKALGCKPLDEEAEKKRKDCMKKAADASDDDAKKKEEEACPGVLTCDTFGVDSDGLKDCKDQTAPGSASADAKRILEKTDDMKNECTAIKKSAKEGSLSSF